MVVVNPLSAVQTAFSDPLSAGGYRFIVHRLPRVAFAVQQVNVPGVTLNAAELLNPFASIPLAGDHIDYGQFRLTYLVDEQLRNYLEIYDWIRALGKPDSFDEYAALRLEPGSGVASECTLVVLDAKKNPKFSVAFKDSVPVSISDLMFDATIPGVNFIRVTASFRYTDFEFSAL